MNKNAKDPSTRRTTLKRKPAEASEQECLSESNSIQARKIPSVAPCELTVDSNVKSPSRKTAAALSRQNTKESVHKAPTDASGMMHSDFSCMRLVHVSIHIEQICIDPPT